MESPKDNIVNNEAEERALARRDDMSTARGALVSMWDDENGQAMVEFVMIVVALVSVAWIVDANFALLIEDHMDTVFHCITRP